MTIKGQGPFGLPNGELPNFLHFRTQGEKALRTLTASPIVTKSGQIFPFRICPLTSLFRQDDSRWDFRGFLFERYSHFRLRRRLLYRRTIRKEGKKGCLHIVRVLGEFSVFIGATRMSIVLVGSFMREAGQSAAHDHRRKGARIVSTRSSDAYHELVMFGHRSKGLQFPINNGRASIQTVFRSFPNAIYRLV